MERIKEFFKRFKSARAVVAAYRNTKLWLKKKHHELRARINPLKVNRELYVRNHGKEPNLENPENFNEKVMWLLHNVYKYDPLVTKCADKVGMRDYIEELGLGEVLPDIYGVWKRPKDVPWDELPERFVVKCNHGCGCNIICTDKSALDRNDANKKLRRWLRQNFAYMYGEVNYKNIKPMIFAEEFLDDGTGKQPVDYKLMCFHGEPRMIMVCTQRETGAKFMFTDPDYNDLSLEKGWHAGGTLPERPACLEQMLEAGRQISKGFPFVRVDFYSIKGKPYLGEMTFSPLGCAIDYITDDGLKMMGDWLDISAYKKGVRK